MEELVIREATEGDIEAILAVYQSAGIESERPFTTEEARFHFSIFSDYPNYRLFVCVMDGVIVATYELLIMDNLAKRGQRTGIVEDVAVSPRHQDRGIGRVLMKHAMRQCERAGCYKLTLSSGMKRTRAHDFYDSAGFERHGISFLVALDAGE